MLARGKAGGVGVWEWERVPLGWLEAVVLAGWPSRERSVVCLRLAACSRVAACRLFHFRRETATTTSSDPHARHFAPPRRLVRPSAACHAHLIVESNRIDHPHAYYQQGWPLFFIETRRANNRTTTASEAAVPAPLTHQHPPSHPHRIRTPSLAAWRASLGGGGSCRASLPTWVSSRHWPCKYVSASASRVCV